MNIVLFLSVYLQLLLAVSNDVDWFHNDVRFLLWMLLIV